MFFFHLKYYKKQKKNLKKYNITNLDKEKEHFIILYSSTQPLHYSTSPYSTSPYHTLIYPTYPTIPYPTLPYNTLLLPYPTLPYPTLPSLPSLPYPTLPYPTLPYQVNLDTLLHYFVFSLPLSVYISLQVI